VTRGGRWEKMGGERPNTTVKAKITGNQFRKGGGDKGGREQSRARRACRTKEKGIKNSVLGATALSKDFIQPRGGGATNLCRHMIQTSKEGGPPRRGICEAQEKSRERGMGCGNPPGGDTASLRGVLRGRSQKLGTRRGAKKIA